MYPNPWGQSSPHETPSGQRAALITPPDWRCTQTAQPSSAGLILGRCSCRPSFRDWPFRFTTTWYLSVIYLCFHGWHLRFFAEFEYGVNQIHPRPYSAFQTRRKAVFGIAAKDPSGRRRDFLFFFQKTTDILLTGAAGAVFAVHDDLRRKNASGIAYFSVVVLCLRVKAFWEKGSFQAPAEPYTKSSQ